jgi:hypothetical protein
MSRGKYLSLEEARKFKQLEQFAKEHPSQGDMNKLFEGIKNVALNKPVKKPSKGNRTSKS